MIYFIITIKNLHVECNMKIMIKKINGFQKLEEAKERYLKDSKKFKDLLNNCPGSCFQKIGTIDFVDDNENFNTRGDFRSPFPKVIVTPEQDIKTKAFKKPKQAVKETKQSQDAGQL